MWFCIIYSVHFDAIKLVCRLSQSDRTKNDYCHEQLGSLLQRMLEREREKKSARNYSHFARCQHLILIGQLAMGQTTQCTHCFSAYAMKIAHQCILNQCETGTKPQSSARDNKVSVNEMWISIC